MDQQYSSKKKQTTAEWRAGGDLMEAMMMPVHFGVTGNEEKQNR